MDQVWKTRGSLIVRAKNPDDHDAWNEFVSYYEPFIKMVLSRHWRLHHGHDDLVQLILIRLWKNLIQFDENRENVKFRSWLSGVIRNEALNYIKSQKKWASIKTIDSEVPVHFEKVECETEEKIEKEWQAFLCEKIMDHMNELFTGRAMEVFTRTIEGEKAEEIAEKLDIKVETVYKLRSRVKAKFKRELKQLKEKIEPHL